jgi:hypothetical protein
MGLLSNIAGRIERAFAGDKDQVIIRAAQGATGPLAPTGFNLLQAYGYDVLADYLRLDASLLERYADYEEMDDYPEIASAIDIFADDATQPDTVNNRTVWCTSKNVRVRTEVDNMIRRLNLDEEAWEITRSLVKYGNDFEELLVNDDGVIGLNYLPAPSVRRIEGRHGELYGFIQDPRGKIGFSVDDYKAAMAKRQALITGDIKAGEAGTDPTIAFEDWEVVHFRLRGKHRRSVYGHSVLDSARWIWRRLMLLEDAAMIYRLHRAPERFAFYVNVGDRSDQEAMLHLNRMRQQFRKNKYVNPRTGYLDQKVNPPAQDEDFYIPFRTGEDGSRVEMLSAPAWQHMDDVEYFRSKLFAAMKIPRAYLGEDDGAVRSVLSSQDIRFARTVLRVQREVRNGIRKMARVHLSALNIDPNSVDFDIQMTVPSALLELAQIEARAARADLAARMRDFVSLHWVLEHVFNLDETEIQTIFLQRDEDLIREGKAQGAAQAAAQPPMDMGGDAFGADSMGMAPEDAAASEPPEGEGSESPVSAGPFESRKDRSRSRAIFSARRIGLELPSGRKLKGLTPTITERELMTGTDREGQRRVAEKLEVLLKNDKALAGRLQELRELMGELRSSVGTRGTSRQR